MFIKKVAALISLFSLTCFFSGLSHSITKSPEQGKDKGPSKEKITLIAKSAKPFVIANKKQIIPIKISLRGSELNNSSNRAPVNVSLVLDKSGSMEGEKITQLKEASKLAIGILNEKDSLSLITYDDLAKVVFPGQKLSNKNQFISAVNEIKADGSTALFDGVKMGASEVDRLLRKDQVNRILLISDGLANVGPSSPSELAKLGSSLRERNISVSTIGLGLDYNEDLMSKLAQKSDGNHAFVENAEQLSQVFQKEFGDILSVVGQNVTVKIICADGVRPVRVLGREATINGQEITLNLNQIYSGQEKYIIAEVEIPAKPSNENFKVANIDASYFNLITKSTNNLSETISVAYTSSEELARDKESKDVMVDYVEQVSVENSLEALKAKDEGRSAAAEEIMQRNSNYLQENAVKYAAPKLDALVKESNESVGSMAAPSGSTEWNKQRKKMIESQSKSINQRSW